MLDTEFVAHHKKPMRWADIALLPVAMMAAGLHCSPARGATLQDCEGMSRTLRNLEGVDREKSGDLVRAMRTQDWESVPALLMLGAADSATMTPHERAIARRLRNSLALIPLAAAGDDAEIERRLAARANPNIDPRLDDYMTPLAWAAKCDRTSTIRLLLANGANIDQPVGYAVTATSMRVDSTALLEASRWGIAGSVRELLRRGANPNVRDRYRHAGGGGVPGAPPIMYAASNDILEMLLDAGADPNLADGDGETALMDAVVRSDAAAVTMLLDHGADPALRSASGESALDIAQRLGRRDLSALLQSREAAPTP